MEGNYAWQNLSEAPEVSDSLATLDLKGNSIKDLPDNYARLSQLKVLNLCQNKLTKLPNVLSQIPIEQLSTDSNKIVSLPFMPRITHLGLSSNRLHALPHNFFALKSLINVTLNNNFLQRIPKAICQLSHLSFLDLSHNELTKIPDEICGLPLETLVLSFNKLKRLPDCFGLLSRLRTVALANNKLKLLPRSFEDLIIDELDVSNNRLPQFGHGLPRRLTKLICSNNNLEELPDNLPNLTHLCASGNRISKVPVYRHLEYLNLTSNQIRHFYQTLPSLRCLLLSSNHIEHFPPFAHFPRLELLTICNNRLTSLPDAADAPLVTLNVSHNFLRRLPKLSRTLVKLSFDNNQFARFPFGSLAQIKLRELNAVPNPYKAKHRTKAHFARWKARVPLLRQEWFK
jgi:internalin A